MFQRCVETTSENLIEQKNIFKWRGPSTVLKKDGVLKASSADVGVSKNRETPQNG